MPIDKIKKSNRLLANRRYTHETFTDVQEAFTSTLDLNASEIYIQQKAIPTSSLKLSGSTQDGQYVTSGSENILKFWYRKVLAPSQTPGSIAGTTEVFFFIDPTPVGNVDPQEIQSGQQTNFISPKYSEASLTNNSTEDATPGYNVVITAGGSVVGGANYQFDYKTGVLQFSSSAPTTGTTVTATVYQYVGKTLDTFIASGSGGGGTGTGFPFSGNAVITGSLLISGSDTIDELVVSGNIIATQGFTGSLLGTASWTDNIYIAPTTVISNLPIALVVNNTTLAKDLNDDFTFNPSTNRLIINNGQVIATGFTGSLFGTASWANNATNASTASWASNVNTASWASNALTASWATNVNTASWAQTSSHALNAFTASWASNINTASWATNATNASTASWASNINTASWAQSASHALNARTASWASNVNTASWANNATNASTASWASNINTASWAQTASHALNAFTASYANSINTLNQNITINGTASINTLTITNNATIGGDLIVNGTASYINVQDLLVEDKFILLNSGSTGTFPTNEGGIIVQTTTIGGVAYGTALYYDQEANRWIVNRSGSVAWNATSSLFTTQSDFIVTVTGSGGAPTGTPVNFGTGDSLNSIGQMYINTTNSDIYIYA
jgi:hypothetical protein